MDPLYATREDIMSATDVKASAREAAQIDADLDAQSRTVEQLMHRKFYPWTGVRYFDYPDQQRSAAYRVWFDQFDLTSLTAVANGDGTAIPVGNIFLNPQDGPPYTYADVNQGGPSAYDAGDTWQRALRFTGVWGYANSQVPGGTVTGGVNSSATTLGVSDSSLVGVGSLLAVDSERLQVTAKNLTDTTADLVGDIAASAGVTSVTITSGSLVQVGEFVTVGSEMMQVVDKAGAVLVVKRAVSGSVLASHTSGDGVFAPRSLTVVRGVTGTTAGAISLSDAVTVWQPPGPIRNLTVALVGANTSRRQGGWSAKQQKSMVDDIEALTAQVVAGYGRMRSAAV